MKTVMEQLIEIQDKLDALKAQEQGNSQVTLSNRTVVKLTFTEEQVIAIATELVKRTVETCKEAVENTDLDDNVAVELELNYNNQIEINLNNDDIKDGIKSEIDDHVNLDSDSIADEVGSIIGYLGIEC